MPVEGQQRGDVRNLQEAKQLAARLWAALEEMRDEQAKGRLAGAERADHREGALVAAAFQAGDDSTGSLAHQRRHLVAVEPVTQIPEIAPDMNRASEARRDGEGGAVRHSGAPEQT